MKVFATQYTEGLKEAAKTLKEQGIELSWHSGDELLSDQKLNDHAKNYDALITMLCDNIDDSFLESNSHLKVIANYAVGTNNISLKKAKGLGIAVGNTPDVLTHTTAETALTLLLMVARKIPFSMNEVTKGNWKTWEPTLYNGYDLRGKTLGLIGDGRIGQSFSQMAKSLWNCRVITYPYKDRGVSQEEFFTEADIVSLHCPLNENSLHLIDHQFINQMKKPFLFINTARGACHVEADLLAGLKKGKILGIGLDVTDPEPMPSISPLLKRDDVVVFPHIGSATDKTRREMTAICLKNIEAGLKGEPLPFPA